MANPLADYVTSLPPYFDFTDARTWYDGLWDRGLWPPEGYPGVGMRGLGESIPGGTYPPAYFPGDWARLRAASLRGLGQSLSDCPSGNLYCPDYPDTSTCTCATASTPMVDVYQLSSGGKLLPVTQYVGSAPSSTVTPQTQNAPTPNVSTQTWVMVGMAAAIAVLFIVAVRR